MFRRKTLLVAAFASALVYPLSLPLPVENFPTSMGEAQAAGKKSHKKDKRKAYKKARRKTAKHAQRRAVQRGVRNAYIAGAVANHRRERRRDYQRYDEYRERREDRRDAARAAVAIGAVGAIVKYAIDKGQE